jgi:hypothetical protein
MFVYLTGMPPYFFTLRTQLRTATLAVLLFALGGCAAGTQLDDTDSDDDGTRPGALSGPSGEFIIFGE